MTHYVEFSKIPSESYHVLVTDPPWLYSGDPNKDQAAGKHYPCMSVADMVRAFDVRRILKKQNVVFVWATSPRLHDAIALIGGWGLYFRGVAKVWVKTTLDGRVINGQGVRPSIIKPTTEHLLLASSEESDDSVEYLLAGSTKKEGRPLGLLSESQRQVVFAPRPGGIHSRKPDVFLQDIEELFGSVPRLEMFARRSRDGWDTFGNEPDLVIQPKTQ